jgi:hypothetical protein
VLWEVSGGEYRHDFNAQCRAKAATGSVSASRYSGAVTCACRPAQPRLPRAKGLQQPSGPQGDPTSQPSHSIAGTADGLSAPYLLSVAILRSRLPTFAPGPLSIMYVCRNNAINARVVAGHNSIHRQGAPLGWQHGRAQSPRTERADRPRAPHKEHTDTYLCSYAEQTSPGT